MTTITHADATGELMDKAHRKLLAHQYKIHWWQRPLLFAEGALGAHLGALMIVAVYYMLFELNPTMTHWWHQTVPNPNTRHDIRDIGEVVLGGLIFKAFIWNHFSKSHQRAGRYFDKLHDRLHIPALPVAIVSSVVFTTLIFIIAEFLLHHFVHYHASTVGGTAAIYSDWPKKLIGIGCVLLGSRPLHDVYDDAQQWFAVRRIALKPKGKLHFWLPVPFRNRVRYERQFDAPDKSYAVSTVLIPVATVLALALAGYGYYILNYVA